MTISAIRDDMIEASPVSGANVTQDKIEVLIERISRSVTREMHHYFQGNRADVLIRNNKSGSDK